MTTTPPPAPKSACCKAATRTPPWLLTAYAPKYICSDCGLACYTDQEPQPACGKPCDADATAGADVSLDDMKRAVEWLVGNIPHAHRSSSVAHSLASAFARAVSAATKELRENPMLVTKAECAAQKARAEIAEREQAMEKTRAEKAEADLAVVKTRDEFNFGILKAAHAKLEMQPDQSFSLIPGEIEEWVLSHERIKADRERVKADLARLTAENATLRELCEHSLRVGTAERYNKAEALKLVADLTAATARTTSATSAA